MSKEPSSRVARSRDSLYLALVAMIREDGYNLSIQSSELCARANKSRATFFRQYRQVGDIFRAKDQELLTKFSELDLSNMSRKLVWQRVLVFILQYREIFEFKFEYDRDEVLRQMLYKIRDLVAPELRRYEPKLANKLFEMLYAEVRSIIKIWLKEGAKTEEISQVARCLDCTANSVCKKWSGFFSTT